MKQLVQRRPLLVYFILAYGLTWLVLLPLLMSRRGSMGFDIPEDWEALGAFGPFFAALLVVLALQGREGLLSILRSLGRWRVGAGWVLFTVLSPPTLLVVVIIVLGLNGVKLAEPNGMGLAELATFSGLFDLIFIGGVLQGLGEEPGWRGFALPRLRQRLGPLAASAVLFPVWLCWHLPVFLSRPDFGLVQWLGFSLGIFSATIWLTLIYDATRSVLMAVIWHVLVNIARGIALAISVPVFLAMGNAVLIGALVIAVYWLVKRPGPVTIN